MSMQTTIMSRNTRNTNEEHNDQLSIALPDRSCGSDDISLIASAELTFAGHRRVPPHGVSTPLEHVL